MSEMVCKICNQQVENRIFVKHLATHMISPKDYYDSIYGVHHCPICGKATDFKNVFKGYNKYCSRTCLNKSSIHINSVKQTKISRYNDANYTNQEKRLKTLASRSEADKQKTNQKRSQTKLDRYGDDNYNNSQKYKNTCMQVYGVSCPFQDTTVKQKIANKYNAKSDSEKQQIYAKRQATLDGKSEEEKRIINQKHRDAYNQKTLSEKAEINHKIYLTKKKNHSLKASKVEDLCYQQLLQIYPETKHGYKSKAYPFVCDLYIPVLDVYIELNFHWTHGHHPYDKEKDKDQLAHWIEKAKTSQFYKNAIQTWTIRDVKKIKVAKDNKVNLLVFYNKSEFDAWLSMQQCL